MSEQEQFEHWFENDTKGLDKDSARAGWVERMAQESAELAQLREERDSQQRVCIQAMQERDELRAKLAAYERQEPIGYWSSPTGGSCKGKKYAYIGSMPSVNDTGLFDTGPLYASPAPAPIVMPDAATKLLRIIIRKAADAENQQVPCSKSQREFAELKAIAEAALDAAVRLNVVQQEGDKSDEA